MPRMAKETAHARLNPDRASLADVLQALGDPVRLKIVRKAAGNPNGLACGEFGIVMPKATLSYHFKVLRQAGIIHAQPDGVRHVITLRRDELDGRFPGLLQAVLHESRTLQSAGRVAQTSRLHMKRQDAG